ncbi:MAG TPA: phosphotransferase [Verrucomicrobiae bacterium]|nr:phosphotransferase [Verrucomicrobiae bacterium]
MVIGVDFDNTIVSYDDLLRQLAQERGLIDTRSLTGKKSIRDRIRRLPDGEIEWQKLQALLYGSRMSEAQLIAGVPEFFRACRQRHVHAVIVSHKTERSGYDDTHANLREAALSWMKAHGFFDPDGLGLRPEDVHFASTRAEKIEAIKRLGCTVFVDDLEETYLEPSFPPEIEKVLFAPHGHPPLPGVHVCRSWSDIREHVFHETADAFSRLLGQPVPTLEWIGGGGNSRIYKLPGPHAGKVYFGQRRHDRNRLEVEFHALQFLWNHGVRCVPKPIAADAQTGHAVYEFIDGSRLSGADATEADIDDAVDFLAALKRLASDPDAAALPPAAEACFSTQAIIENLQARLARVAAAPPLQEFLNDSFRPTLKRMTERLPPDGELPLEQRTLSPSDFGFHNALRRPDGRLLFLDFEYFGWDDPAKMISDFLLHPALELPEPLKRRFVTGIYRRLDANKSLAKRVETVYPLFGLKWCLIMLNEFVPEDWQRRGFASGGSLDRVAAQTRQLDKARRMLARIEREYEGFPYRD